MIGVILFRNQYFTGYLGGKNVYVYVVNYKINAY